MFLNLATTASVYLFEDDPVVNRFISVPKDQSSSFDNLPCIYIIMALA